MIGLKSAGKTSDPVAFSSCIDAQCVYSHNPHAVCLTNIDCRNAQKHKEKEGQGRRLLRGLRLLLLALDCLLTSAAAES